MANQNPQSENNRPNQNQGTQKKVREFPGMQSQNPEERDARDLQGKNGLKDRDPSKRNASSVSEGEDFDEDMLANEEENDERDNERSERDNRSNRPM